MDPSLPSSPRGPTGLILHSEGGTAVISMATGQATVRAASVVIPRSRNRPKMQMLHAYKHALVSGHITALPQGSLCTAGKPVVPAGALGLLESAGSLRPQQEVGGKHRQPLNSLLPAKPRLSPAEPSPSQGRSAGAHPPCNSKPCAGPPGQKQGQRCREGIPLHSASSGRAAGAAAGQTPVALRIR